VLLDRLFFQLTAAIAAAPCCGSSGVAPAAWRPSSARTPPAPGPIIVNGGHNDIVIGLAVLARLCWPDGGSAGQAGLVIGAAALIK